MSSLEQKIEQQSQSLIKPLIGLGICVGAIEIVSNLRKSEYASTARIISYMGAWYGLWHGARLLESYAGIINEKNTQSWMIRAGIGAVVGFGMLYAGTRFDYGILDDVIKMIGMAGGAYAGTCVAQLARQ